MINYENINRKAYVHHCARIACPAIRISKDGVKTRVKFWTAAILYVEEIDSYLLVCTLRENDEFERPCDIRDKFVTHVVDASEFEEKTRGKVSNSEYGEILLRKYIDEVLLPNGYYVECGTEDNHYWSNQQPINYHTENWW